MQQEGAGGRQADATLARMCRHLALPSVAPHSLRLRSLIVIQFSALLNFSLALFLQFCLIFRHVTCLCRAKASAGCLATCCSCSLCHQLFNGSASQMANVLLASPARARVPAMSKSISYAQPFAANQFHLSLSLSGHAHPLPTPLVNVIPPAWPGHVSPSPAPSPSFSLLIYHRAGSPPN